MRAVNSLGMKKRGHPEFSSGSADCVVVCCCWTLTATTQDVDSETPAERKFRMTPIFITALLYRFVPSSRKVFIRDLSLWLSLSLY